MNGTVRIPRRCGSCGHYDRMHYDSAFPDGRTCGWMESYGPDQTVHCSCSGFVESRQDAKFPPNETRPAFVPDAQMVLIP